MKIMIIDGSALCHMMFHALPSMSFEGVNTSIIFGFLTKLLHYQQKFDADRIVFAWDSKKSKREEIFPEYKRVRKEAREKQTEEEKELAKPIKVQFSLIRKEILPDLGFSNIFYQDGYEGDDIIASVCKNYKEREIIIISSDSDLYQLITERHLMFNIRNRVMITEEAIFNTYGIYPHKFADMKGISGCITDNVPGVPGIGDKTAIKYLCGDLKRTSKTYQNIVNSSELIEKTRKLVVLPFEGVDSFVVKPDTCTLEKWQEVIKSYGFKSLQDRNVFLEIRSAFCDKTSSKF